jgi:CHAT domain-containing protein
LRVVSAPVFVCLSILAGSLLSCHTAANPQVTYDRIELEIRHGDLNGASIDVEQALERFGRATPEWHWRFRILKGEILVSQSDYSGALACLDGDLPSSLSGTDAAIQKSMYAGIAYRIGQDFEKSQRAFAAAEALASPPHQRLLSRVLTAKGALEIDQANYEAANVSYGRALVLARQQHDRDLEAAVLLDLGRLDTLRQRFDEAIDRSEAALSLSRALKKQSFVATILGNLGWAYSELGDFENALKFYKQGADESSKSGMTGYSVYWFSGVADSYMALREYTSAEELARSTLKRALDLKNAQTTTACLNTLAEVMLRTHRLTEAEQFDQEALKIEEAGKDKFGKLGSLLLAGEIAAAQRSVSKAEESFRRVLADPSAETPLRWQAEAGLAGVRDDQGRSAEAERQYLNAIGVIEKARRSINHDELRLSFLTSGIGVYEEYIDFLIRHGRSAEAMNQAEFSRARTLAEGLSFEGPGANARSALRVQPQQLAQQLHATLLFYWLGQTRSYLWVITSAKTTRFTLRPAPEIDSVVKSYREAMVNAGDPLQAGNPDGQKLYELLLEPAKNLIPPGSRVILLPDGSLYSLSFETLIVPGAKPHYWIEDVTLTTASSLMLLASAATRPAPKEKSMFLVGDTVPPNADFPALPQAGAEMRSIEKYFPESRRAVLSGSEATPAAYLAAKPEQFAYLHFVTHGTASRARPLESAVVLSKEKDEDSYKLYARDIIKRRLSAYLVTISACNGAGTRAFSGEGLVGLSWAFLRAGARNVIGALWEVSDTSTPQLMDTLYAGLNRGQDPASALRAAKLSLLHSDSVFKKPYYWAPFQLYAGS